MSTENDSSAADRDRFILRLRDKAEQAAQASLHHASLSQRYLDLSQRYAALSEQANTAELSDLIDALAKLDCGRSWAEAPQPESLPLHTLNQTLRHVLFCRMQ